MKALHFYIWLTLTASASLTFSYLFRMEKHAEGMLVAQMILVSFFIFFTITMYYVAKLSIKSVNPYLFTRVFMVSVFFKIILLSMLVFALVRVFGLVPKQLALPLGLSYLFFTVFETWMLMKLSKVN